MFDVGRVFSTFNSSPYYNGKFNGADGYIMQSQEYTDQLISEFERLVAAGYNPNTVVEDVFDSVGVTESDLTEFDKQRLMRKVNAAWDAHQSRRY